MSFPSAVTSLVSSPFATFSQRAAAKHFKPRATRTHVRTQIATRAHAARNFVMSTAADAYQGKPTIHMVWRVPASDEAEVDAYWTSHGKFMNDTHSFGTGPEPNILKYYIAKGKELNDPMDPNSGETGNILYIMAEVYASSESIPAHMAKGTAEWPGMGELGAMHGKYGVVMELSCGVFTCLSDAATTSATEEGQPTIHMVWRVPSADEAAVDAYWKSHESWLRKSHVMGAEGDDAVTPRLTSFSINKGKELNDPMDANSGETGNLLYIMSESYVSPAGIASHMEKGGADWSGMAELGPMHAKYGVFMEVGACSVFTTMKK